MGPSLELLIIKVRRGTDEAEMPEGELSYDTEGVSENSNPTTSDPQAGALPK
jgi:hypothetical protein